jgi:lipoate synthase
VPPEEFARFKAAGRQMGFAVVVSEPLVRSSFHSDEQTEFVRAAIRGEGRRARS